MERHKHYVTELTRRGQVRHFGSNKVRNILFLVDYFKVNLFITVTAATAQNPDFGEWKLNPNLIYFGVVLTPRNCRWTRVKTTQLGSTASEGNVSLNLAWVLWSLTMGGCSAPNCSNSTTIGKQLFRFPKDPARKKKWVVNCRRDFVPTPHSRLCQASCKESHRASQTVSKTPA